MQQRKNHQDLLLESRDIPLYVNTKNDRFSQIYRNQGRNEKVVQEKFVSFGVLDS